MVKPEWDKYERGVQGQPTVCGQRAPDGEVVKPSDFVAMVNLRDGYVPDEGAEALPYQDGDYSIRGEPCADCEVAAPLSWPFLEYFRDMSDG